MVSGSTDTTSIVWELGDSSLRPMSVLCGHSQPVTSVTLSYCLDLAVTASKDGTVNVHSIREGKQC